VIGFLVILIAILVLFKIETEGLKIKSIELRKFGNKVSKESETVTDNSDNKTDNTSSTEPETTADPFNNNTEPNSEIRDTKEQTKEEDSSVSDLQENFAKQSNEIKEVKKDISTLIKNVKDMTETFMSLQKALNEKDEEIKRFKKGYDAKIFNDFLLRFARVDKILKEYKNVEGMVDAIKDIQISMDDALAECGVESFSPELGHDYKNTKGVSDNPEIQDTTDEKLDSKIAKILQPGYRRILPDGAEEEFQIIVPAKVAIYVYNKSENN